MIRKIKITLGNLLAKIKTAFFYKSELEKKMAKMSGDLSIKEWKEKGMPVPPPGEYKQEVVKVFAKKFGKKHLIETGTFVGQMIDATKDSFSKIESIEIDKKLHEVAVKKFKKLPFITIYLGDSQGLLPKLLLQKTSSCVYWLDAHYSGGITGKGTKDTPVIDELNIILKYYNDDVILIDDARKFTGEHDYPTIEQITKRISDFDKQMNIEVYNDIIRIYKGPLLSV